MALPVNWKQVPVVGGYVGLDGKPIAKGRLTFTSKTTVAIGGKVIVPKEITFILDSEGQLPAGAMIPTTNDPDLSQNSWMYTVHETWKGGRKKFTIVVPFDSNELDMSTVLPSGPVD